jgi:hypothetical protein
LQRRSQLSLALRPPRPPQLGPTGLGGPCEWPCVRTNSRFANDLTVSRRCKHFEERSWDAKWRSYAVGRHTRVSSVAPQCDILALGTREVGGGSSISSCVSNSGGGGGGGGGSGCAVVGGQWSRQRLFISHGLTRAVATVHADGMRNMQTRWT